MSTNNHSNQKFEEALALLNDAAKDKKDELQGLITDKYSHLKEALHDAALSNQEALKRLRKQAERAVKYGTEQAKDVAEDIDEKVRQNPWAYIGGAAVGALLLGFILGASSRNNR